MENSKGRVPEKQMKTVESIFTRNFRTSQRSSILAAPFSTEEVFEAVKQLQCGKAPGYDNAFPDNLTHLRSGAMKWLTKLFSNIHNSGKLPKEWKRAKVVAVLKPNKSAENPSNYRPISLLSCCLKLFERCLLGRIQQIIGNVIQKEQAGFQKNRSCCDQVLALTNYIELGFEKNLKTGVVLLDLSAAYDTVWKRGLLMKLSKIIPCRKTLSLLTNMLSDRTFQVSINGKCSRKRSLNNGLPQGSVLSCILYCLYTSDIPKLRSRQFIYADDIAIAYQAKSFKDLEDVLNMDLNTLSKYFTDWRLKPNTGKTVHCIFHLNIARQTFS